MDNENPIQPSRCAEQLSALAAPERLKIIQFLRNGPKNVTEISEMLKTAPVNVAHHMAVLKQAGIATGEKKGRFVFYSVTPGFIQNTNCNDDQEFLNLGCCRLEMPKK